MNINVQKRDGRIESFDVNKIQRRIQYLNDFLVKLDNTDITYLVNEVMKGLKFNMNTTEIDDYTATVASHLACVHPEYRTLAARISISNNQKKTQTSFKDKMRVLYEAGRVDRVFYKFVDANQKAIETMIDYNRDFLFDYFGFQTMLNSYIIKVKDVPIERPQDVYMRVAVYLCFNEDNFQDATALKNIHLTYDLLSLHLYTHATPTLLNSGTKNPQLSSCFLLGSQDSLEGIMKTGQDAAKISKFSGGIGIHVDEWRCRGSHIEGTNGRSNGVLNFLRIYNNIMRAFDQGGGHRKGAAAIYLQPHHADIRDFLLMRLQTRKDEFRAADLHHALFIPDLFMEKVKKKQHWYLMDPAVCRELNSAYGDEYRKLYEKLVEEGKYKEKVSARTLWNEIVNTMIQTGEPYIHFKDSINRKNNLSHYSPILSSNLCSEINLPSNRWEYGVCNLASICLPMFVVEKEEACQMNDPEEVVLQKARTATYTSKIRPTNPVFDFRRLASVVQWVTRLMNRVIDINYYPTPETKIGNMLHRPIGIGVSGLADTYYKLGLNFTSPEAAKINKAIFETMSYASYTASSHMAKEISNHYKPRQFLNQTEEIFSLYEKWKELTLLKEQISQLELHLRCDLSTTNTLEQLYSKRVILDEECSRFLPRLSSLSSNIGVYPSYLYGEGAPISRGMFSWKLWGLKKEDLSGMWDWDTLEEHIKRFGIRNSLLTAVMPTATTSQTLGVNECIEPYTANMYRRTTNAGEFIVVNPYLCYDLMELGLWDSEMVDEIIQEGGSILSIDRIPEYVRDKYRTIWEISQRVILEQARDRGAFIDHSQSMNIYFSEGDFDKVQAMLFSGWEQGLKTGCYYLKTQPASQPIKFNLPYQIKSKSNPSATPALDTINPPSTSVYIPNDAYVCLSCGC